MSLAKDIKHVISFLLPPKDAIKYMEQKGYKLTFDYREMMHEAHHKAFTVAKITRLDLLSDIKESIIEAQKNGLSFQNWKKNIKPILIKKGWWGEVEVRNPKTGETKKIFVGNRRLKTIFYTNARVSYQVAKAKKYYEDNNVKYLKYIAILDNKTRPSHRALHGTILPKDDPFWETHYPPNGWNCRCRVRAIPAHKKVTPTDKKNLPKNAVDKDWAYDVRKGAFDNFQEDLCIDGYNAKKKCKVYIEPNQPTFKDYNLPSVKDISDLPKPPRLIKKAKTKKEAFETLKKEILGDKQEVKVKTPIGDVLIEENGLRHISKANREQYAKFIIPTLKEPDEIYRTAYSDKKKRYHFFKFYKIKNKAAFSVVRINRDGSIFVTFFIPEDLDYIDRRRVGILLHPSGAIP